MQSHQDAFRRCLDELDVAGIRRLWKHVSPNLPQPRNDKDALIALHIARTASDAIEFEKRAYSHRWLMDSGLPSRLPDNLKPGAERIYPTIAQGVGISVNSKSDLFKPILAPVRQAMEVAVLEADADRKLSHSDYVRARMKEARDRTIRKLLGMVLPA